MSTKILRVIIETVQGKHRIFVLCPCQRHDSTINANKDLLNSEMPAVCDFEVLIAKRLISWLKDQSFRVVKSSS